MFKFVEQTKRPYEFDNPVHISITFERELNLKAIDRQVYNLLDLIGDIGGLGEGLFFMTFTLLSVIHFGALDNQIIQELFRVTKSRKSEANSDTPNTAAQTPDRFDEEVERQFTGL